MMKKLVVFLLMVVMMVGVGFTNVDADQLRLRLRPDDTVLDFQTDIIYHRNPRTPGIPHLPGFAVITTRETGGAYINMFEYIDNLNAGVYGTDPMHGNAGYTDWRIPTLNDLLCLYDPMQKNLRIPGKWLVEIGEQAGPNVYGDPFYMCNWFDGPEICPAGQQMWEPWLTNTPCRYDDMGSVGCTPGLHYAIVFPWATEIWSDGTYGEIWPTRDWTMP